MKKRKAAKDAFWKSFSSPWGAIRVGCSAKGVQEAHLLPRNGKRKKTVLSQQAPLSAHPRKAAQVAAQAVAQLEEYFSGKRRRFTLPLDLRGTPFQRRVWKALLQIPYGETRSYRQIARQVGNPKAARAVGMANHANPVGIIVPCHRVIASDGSLGGYAGGIRMKARLLRLEGSNRTTEVLER